MTNKTLKIKNLKQTIIISTDKKRQLVNKCGLPLRFKVPKGYTINKQAKRDSKRTSKISTDKTERTKQAWSNLLKGL